MGKTPFVTAAVLVVAALLIICRVPARGTELPSFEGSDGWINTSPLSRADLSGKVVLVDFWEYTCVNCVRTFPTLRKWYRDYGPKGLVIVGIHTPEFTFGQKRSNVQKAVTRFKLAYPVVLDNHMVLWDRFRNHYWPAEYLFDRNGRLVYHSIGEGDYDEMEKRIRSTLDLNGKPPGSSVEEAPYHPEMTRELYAGSERGLLPAPAEVQSLGNETVSRFSGCDLRPDRFNPRGTWSVHREYLLPRPVQGHSPPVLLLPYHASGVHLVLRPAGTKGEKIRVTLDGHPVPRSVAGPDIRFDRKGHSYLAVGAARMYDLTAHQPFGSYTLGLEPQGNGPAIYSATFDPG